mmetsp:Transcript_5183/g.7803  ORF Transcript_5183/g.7803 Transcript_5183/m.7803 type:complete len:91 (-) Transcript_5183:122-394(-)
MSSRFTCDQRLLPSGFANLSWRTLLENLDASSFAGGLFFDAALWREDNDDPPGLDAAARPSDDDPPPASCLLRRCGGMYFRLISVCYSDL